jgi:hypothetical protein
MSSRTKKTLTIVAICLFVGWIGFLFAVNRAMHQQPEQFGRFMSKLPMPAYFVIPFETLWMRARAGTLNAGETAPDFNLEAYDKSGMVQLSSFRGQKPVVLVFGSYT